MATGTVTINITIPVTNANDPNRAGRGIALEVIEQARQVIGGMSATSGNLTWPAGAAAQVVGTWTFTPPT